MKVLRFNNGRLWWPPFCLASKRPKRKNAYLQSKTYFLHSKTDQYDFIK